MTDVYAVVGNPIEHSLSPIIHQMFADQTGEDICYSRELIQLGQFNAEVSRFFKAGGSGLNVTLPFKLEAFDYADSLSDSAARAGAVNTLKRLPDGRIYGDNTDGRGLVYDICERLRWPLKGASVLLLGAGGAARGALAPLFAGLPTDICIANRTAVKAETLATQFASLGCVTGVGFDAIPAKPFDLIINATSSGLSGEVPLIPTPAPDTRCYDMLYASTDTPFLAAMRSAGCSHLSDGLGMLVGQAAEAFLLWRGCRPEVEPVIQWLRARS